MAIHNKFHNNHALMSLNKIHKDDNIKYKSAADLGAANEVKLYHSMFNGG